MTIDLLLRQIRARANLVVALFALSVSLILLVGWDAKLIHTASGDDATTYALHALFRSGLLYGRDIVCPCGPWAISYFPQFHPETYWMSIAGQALFATAMAVILTHIANRYIASITLRLVFIATALGLFSVAPDARYFYVSLLALTFLQKAPRAIYFVLLSAVAFTFLVKATFIATTLVILTATLTTELLRERRVPIASLFLVFTIALLHAMAGQAPGDLFAYVLRTLESADGYPERFSETGSLWELFAFLFLAGLSWLAIVITEIRRQRSIALVYIVGYSAILFLLFKTSFVRQDGQHVIRGFFTLLPFMASYFAMNSHSAPVNVARSAGSIPRRPSWLKLWKAGLAAATFFLAAVVTQYPSLYMGKMARLEIRLTALAGVALAGRDYFTRHHEAALASIRTEHPLPSLGGPVAVFSSLQTPAIAHGLQLKAMPSLAPDLATTSTLEEANRSFFANPNAPDYVLFRDALFAHHIASLGLLQNYRITGASGGFLILQKHANGLHEETPLRRQRVAWGTDVALPSTGDMIWARVSYQRTLIGSLLGFLYQPPPVYLVLSDEKGEVSRLRASSRLLQQGVLVSPVLTSIESFASTFTDAAGNSSRRTRSIRFVAGEANNWLFPELQSAQYFYPDIDIELFQVRITGHKF